MCLQRLWQQGLLLGLLISLSNCAVLHKNNRYITDVLEETAPESSVGRAALAPIATLAGMTALLLDGAVIHPLVSIPEALDDGTWVFTEVEFMGPFEIIAFPMRLITFPVIVVGSEILRISMPFDWSDD